MKSISGMLALTLTVILFSGCSADEASLPQQSSVEVETQTAQLSPSLSETMFPATVESHNRANLSTIVMGTVTAAPITVGDRVKKGDLLVRIKDDQIRAQKSQIEANKVQAKANLENTEKNYNRIRNLYAEESATSKEMDDISTMYEIAKANMEALEARMNEVNEMLEYTTIRAPFDGIVSRKYISEGDMAAPGHPLITVSDPGSVKIAATVAENQISKLSEGTDVSVSISSAGLNRTPARLTAISEAGDPMSRQFAIEAIIEDESINEQLKTGMFAEIRVNLDQSESLYIPASAVVQRGQLTGIYTISESNRAVLRWVRLGEHSGERVEIITGLTPGEQFVVNPGKSIRQGQLISSR
ncbi:efflux RND transporter periplasmic adaptor subunit [Rhodohalobacter halophilus]|uniref:efflux RND transporter periplasmic adaptor subunit n=1 Tax=Rhodohalobacter halophilus TaxID=1812810 RepID=UPI00083FAADB|nr:efflux RND transporter periplasmic adaptor subunit [Rhodohalobacter halophilus]